MDGKLDSWLRERRKAGWSYWRIARKLDTDHEIGVTAETIRKWCLESGVAGPRKPGPARTPWQDRLWAKIDKRGRDECWPWLGSKSKGHGKFVRNFGDSRVPEQAHRLVYELEVGPIPEDHDLDHECHNKDKSCPGGVTCPHRACCNPRHLEPRTRGDNVRRGRRPGRPRKVAA
jgi:hypothetical protein